MNYYEETKTVLEKFFKQNGIEFNIETSLKDASYDDSNKLYVYDYPFELKVISMDQISQSGYKKLLGKEEMVNTVDAFLVNKNDEWFLIEFKNVKISKKKDNLEKKGLYNTIMMLDLINAGCKIDLRGYDNFLEFSRNCITYIVVFNKDKDPEAEKKVRDSDNMKQKFTPDSFRKFKEYLFKDAYAYSEDYFRERFVKKFSYE